jgi:hypothetical protein
MAGTEDKIFSSKIKFNGIFPFADFYKFCYDWLSEEPGLTVKENKYSEKLSSDSKNIDIEWTCEKEVNEYFKFKVKVEFRIIGLKQVEVVQNNTKVKTNNGSVEVKVGGILVKDYKGKFETSGAKLFLRAIYEKWVISSGVSALQDKLIEVCDDFLSQAKAYLDLEGKK